MLRTPLGSLPPMMSIVEAARLIPMSRSSAYEAAKSGDLPTVAMNGRQLVPTAKLLKLMGLEILGDDAA